MVTPSQDVVALVSQSRQVAASADNLSLALAMGEPVRIEDAVADLLLAYDAYTGQSSVLGGRVGFDGSAEPTEAAAAPAIDAALASALTDLRMAALLGDVAAVRGELGAEVIGESDIDARIGELNRSLSALEGADETRLGFDAEALGAAPREPSPDLPAARQAFLGEARDIYGLLLAQTTDLLTAAFGGLTGLNGAQLRQALARVQELIGALPGGEALPRMLGALERAIATLRGIAGPELAGAADAQLSAKIDEVRSGGDALQAFLRHAYAYQIGLDEIGALLDAGPADPARLDAASAALAAFRPTVGAAHGVERAIIDAVNSFGRPFQWLLGKIGFGLPFDAFKGGLFLLVADVAVLHGMDLADSATLVRLTEGLRTRARRALEQAASGSA